MALIGIDAVVFGVADMAASTSCYVEHGFTVAKSFGRKYVEFATGSSPVKLALYGRRALAKDAGVPAEGTGSHRLVIGTDAGPFTDPDGMKLEAMVYKPRPRRKARRARKKTRQA